MKQSRGKTMTEEANEYAEQVKTENLYKPKMFYYNDWQNPTPIFDFEDIENDENFLVLCARAVPNNKTRAEDTVYVWHGLGHDVASNEQNEFVQKCISVYFGPEVAADPARAKLKIL